MSSKKGEQDDPPVSGNHKGESAPAECGKPRIVSNICEIDGAATNGDSTGIKPPFPLLILEDIRHLRKKNTKLNYHSRTRPAPNKFKMFSTLKNPLVIFFTGQVLAGVLSEGTVCSPVKDVKHTFYGFPDNTPAGAATAYNCAGRNNVAGGTGTHARSPDHGKRTWRVQQMRNRRSSFREAQHTYFRSILPLLSLGPST